MPTTRAFYVTIAANMPYGCGHWEVWAADELGARQLAHEHCPDGRWSFLYASLEEVHPMDRKRHGVIGSRCDG